MRSFLAIVWSVVFLMSTQEARAEGDAWGLHFGLGLTSLNYTDSRPNSNLSQLALTPQLALSRPFFSPRLEVEAEAFIHALTFMRSLDLQLRMLGLDARLGWTLPRPSSPWRISIHAGYYFRTLLVSPDRIGFSRLQGPELFPQLRYVFRGGSTLGLRIRFSPIFSDSGLMSPSNHLLSAGLHSMIAFRRGNSLLMSVEAERIAQQNVQAQNVNISTLALTGSVGLGF